MNLDFKPIGIIHTKLKSASMCPRQGALADNEGEVEIYPEYLDGIKGIEPGDGLWLIFMFNSTEVKNMVVAARSTPGNPRGVFSTRSPHRPNPIGMTLVRVDGISGDRIRFIGADMVDGTFLLDIKPFSPKIDLLNKNNSGK